MRNQLQRSKLVLVTLHMCIHLDTLVLSVSGLVLVKMEKRFMSALEVLVVEGVADWEEGRGWWEEGVELIEMGGASGQDNDCKDIANSKVFGLKVL